MSERAEQLRIGRQGVKRDAIAVSIANGNYDLMRIDCDGTVYWRKDDELVQAQMDGELAQAFAAVVTSLLHMTPQELIDEIRRGRL